MALDEKNMQRLGTLEEMLRHPWLVKALQRLAKLHDRYGNGNPMAVTTDADIARALAFRVGEYQAENEKAGGDSGREEWETHGGGQGVAD